MNISFSTNLNPAVWAQKQVRSTMAKTSSDITRGNSLNHSNATKDADLKNHYDAITDLARNKATEAYAQEQLVPKGNELEQINNILLGMGNVGAIMKSGITLDTETRIAAQGEARNVLQQISNLLSTFSNVDYHAIMNNANINSDGSYNTNYITASTPTRSIEILDGKTLPEAIIPENFRDLIGALHIVIRNTESPTTTNIAPETGIAFINGMNTLLKTQSAASINYEALEKALEESTLRAGENLDEIEKNETVNQEELAGKLHQAQLDLNMLRTIEFLGYRLENQIISMAQSAG